MLELRKREVMHMETELLSTKQAAIEAGVHGAQIFDAIRRGTLHARRSKGRTLIVRGSFDSWKKRLDVRRALREEEAQVKS